MKMINKNTKYKNILGMTQTGPRQENKWKKNYLTEILLASNHFAVTEMEQLLCDAKFFCWQNTNYVQLVEYFRSQMLRCEIFDRKKHRIAFCLFSLLVF